MPPSILFQPPNHIGLGHISRLAAIALSVRQVRPDIRIPFAVEGSSHLLLESLDLPHVAIPSAHELFKNDRWREWTHAERHGLARAMCGAVLDCLAPSLVVFDTFPSMPLVAVARERHVPMVLCLREVKPGVSFDEALRPVLPLLTAILIPHERRGPSVLDGDVRVHYVGRVVRPGRASRARGTGERCRILITGGGGGGGETLAFYNLVLEAAGLARHDDLAAEWLFIAGPLFTDWAALRLIDGVQILPFCADLPAALADSDLVIAQAGYNTVAEIEQSGTCAILVPREGFYDDQRARADESAFANPRLRICRDRSAHALLNLIRAPVAQHDVDVRAPDGAMRAARILVGLLDHPASNVSDS